MKMDGWRSTRLMPNCSARRAPSRATRSPRRSWPESKSRPVTTLPRIASSSPADAATTGGGAVAGAEGSLTGTAVTVPSPRLTLASSAAWLTPASRSTRSGESHGSLPVATVPPPPVCAVAGVITTWVAATASNWRAIWPAVVWANPMVAISEPMPSTVPRMVITSRPGRDPMPLVASTSRSVKVNRSARATGGTSAEMSTGSGFFRFRLPFSGRPSTSVVASSVGLAFRRRRRPRRRVGPVVTVVESDALSNGPSAEIGWPAVAEPRCPSSWVWLGISELSDSFPWASGLHCASSAT